jgi:hypothetical protein
LRHRRSKQDEQAAIVKGFTKPEDDISRTDLTKGKEREAFAKAAQSINLYLDDQRVRSQILADPKAAILMDEGS